MTDQWSDSSRTVLAFGPFRVIPEQRMIMHGARLLKLGSRAREILLTLMERPGEIVTRRELGARVWSGIPVGEGALRVHIAALRKALRAGGNDRNYVESVRGQGYRFIAPVRRLEEALTLQVPQASPTQVSSNVPVLLTPVVGRAQDVASVVQKLPRQRLLTIVGPGGIGKTTVAIAATTQLEASYADGVRFIDLASIRDPALVPVSIAAGLELPIICADPMPSCVEFLESRRLLIVLDNCEHVIEAVAAVAEKVLAATSDIHLLVTSREPIHALCECVLRLRPLEIPPVDAALTAVRAVDFPAVQLFAERAMASHDTWKLDDAEVAVVAEICRALDGLPLAIELAAAHVAVFGVPGLYEHLDELLDFLTCGARTASSRQQTLRATLDWSYELLPPSQKVMLRRLSVFAGGFDIAAARAVAGDERISADELLDILNCLVAKSLLVAEPTGELVHFRLFVTTRAYALERLQGSEEWAEIRRRHALFCCSWDTVDVRLGVGL